MKYIYLGKIANTHGIKGELRILSNFKYKSRVFKKGFKVYIGKEKTEEEIVTYRSHKQFDMITLKGYNNINDVLKYKSLNVFINKEDLTLNEDEYLDEDLINLSVICEGECIGKIQKIEKYPHQDIFVITNNDKKYLVPYVDEFIKEINLEEKTMVINNIKGLIE